MTQYLHTMYRITEPERSRTFYEALGFAFSGDFDIVRNGELEATNYFFSLGDAKVLRELKARKRREGKTLGRLVSELLARALRAEAGDPSRALDWTSRPMGARV